MEHKTEITVKLIVGALRLFCMFYVVRYDLEKSFGSRVVNDIFGGCPKLLGCGAIRKKEPFLPRDFGSKG